MKQYLQRISGFTVIVVGVFMELIGLVLSVFLSVQDETLAAQGGVFSLSNPGHLILIAGLTVTVIGIIIRVTPRLAMIHWTSATILITLFFAFVFNANSLTSAPAAQEHHHEGQTTNGEITHTHGTEINVSWEQLREIDKMLGETKAATEKYVDVNAALADGYKQEGPNHPGEGTHFINRKILDAGIFDLTRPTFLLYEHEPDWSYELVGVGWLLPKRFGDDTPPPYFSPLAAWHYHEYTPPGICFWEDGTTNPYDETSCKSQGGRYWAESPWMLHVWLYRPNPDGIFSLVNNTVNGIRFTDFSSR